MTVTTNNAVLKDLDISGTVIIAASNVTIKNCKIHSTSYYDVQVSSGSVTISSSELYGTTTAAIAGDNWTGTQLNIHGLAGDGMKLGNNTTLKDSWVHDFAPAPGAHADGMQAQNGLANVTVTHNYIDPSSSSGSFANSAIIIKNDLGPAGAGPITISDNLLGGGNYTLYAQVGGSGDAQAGISITGNHFLRDSQYGPTDIGIPVTMSGNVWNNTGQPVKLQ